MITTLLAVVAVVSGAQPEHLPLRGEPGRYTDGYPRQYVDRLALRVLLAERRFDVLTAALSEAQDAFERDTTLEYWPLDAADSVGTAERELLPTLDAWCKAAPDSFAPFLARGTHHVMRAWQERGARWIKDTPPSAIKAMLREARLARADLEHALALRPGAVSVLRMLVVTHRQLGDDPSSVMKAAFAQCPDCFQVRVTIMNSLRPRWGGSYELMESFAKTSQRSDNPRMKILEGYVLTDKAESQLLGPEAYNRALALGEHWQFYVDLANQRSRTDLRAARAALERAAELRPQHPIVVSAQIRVAAAACDWEESARAWSLLHQLDPSFDELERARAPIAQALLPIARARMKEGSPRRALELFDVLLELTPRDAVVRKERDALAATLK